MSDELNCPETDLPIVMGSKWNIDTVVVVMVCSAAGPVVISRRQTTDFAGVQDVCVWRLSLL